MADNPPPTDTNPVISFVSNFLKPFNLPPPFSPPPAKAPQVDPNSNSNSEATPVAEENKKPSSVVRVPQPPQQDSFPYLKIEGEEAQDRETSPSTLWQVYALGGFLVLSWAWRRWNERRGSKKSPEEDDPPASE